MIHDTHRKLVIFGRGLTIQSGVYKLFKVFDFLYIVKQNMSSQANQLVECCIRQFINKSFNA